MYQEIAILKKLDHPNVVKLVEVRRKGEADGLAPALLISKYLLAKISRLRNLWPHPHTIASCYCHFPRLPITTILQMQKSRLRVPGLALSLLLCL